MNASHPEFIIVCFLILIIVMIGACAAFAAFMRRIYREVSGQTHVEAVLARQAELIEKFSEANEMLRDRDLVDHAMIERHVKTMTVAVMRATTQAYELAMAHCGFKRASSSPEPAPVPTFAPGPMPPIPDIEPIQTQSEKGDPRNGQASEEMLTDPLNIG